MHKTERSRKFNIGESVIVMPTKNKAQLFKEKYTILDVDYTNGAYLYKLYFDDNIFVGWFGERNLRVIE